VVRCVRVCVTVPAFVLSPLPCSRYEVMYTPTDIFMVMEYVPNGELFDFIVTKGKVRGVVAGWGTRTAAGGGVCPVAILTRGPF
jgi:hypothetical protein